MNAVPSIAETDLDAFRAAARNWLEENFPASLREARGRPPLMNGEAATGDVAVWKQRMAEKGWGAPTWPVEYGGGGLDNFQAAVLKAEMDAIGAFNPMAPGMGLSMVGPTILEYGTEAQKRRHIPPMVRGEICWCLGYSEPNAGSDLAALQTKAEDAGDHWRINGQKIWTTGAHWSDWCGMLVRTDPGARKHDGVSFLLVDMNQPGVEVRPIRLISGDSHFCEIFFTDARAEKDEMLGELNNGWTVGKRLLQHERASQTDAKGMRPPPLEPIARRYVGLDAAGRLADPDLRMRLASHLIDAKAHELTLARVLAESRGASGASNAASVLKNSATAIAQGRAELLVEMMGGNGLAWEGEPFQPEEIDLVRQWLFGKAMSIYGGSAEIQNNIISKRILGLPDMTRSA
jgi:alkylation response protein AidB-like acyl-CoA dehydrogenase